MEKPFHFLDYNFLLNLTFEDLILHYEDLEKSIQADIIKAVYNSFKENNVKIKGENIIIDGNPYKLFTTFEEEFRNFCISILPIDSSLNKSSFKSKTKISEIGLIHTIVYKVPLSYKTQFEVLQKRIETLVRSAYQNIEQLVKGKFKYFESKLIENLYEIIELQTTNLNKKSLKGSYWFTITKLTNKKTEDDLVIYYFSSSVVDKLIESIKTRNTGFFSPFEILVTLLTEETPDAGMAVFNEGKKEGSIDFEKLINILPDYQKTWISEKTLINDEAVGFLFICNIKDFLLGVSFPVKVRDDIIFILEKAKENIENQFDINVKRYKESFALLVAEDNRGKKYKHWKEIRSMIIEFGAKFAAELSKP